MNSRFLRSIAMSGALVVGAGLAVLGTSAAGNHLLTNGLNDHADSPSRDYETALARLSSLQHDEEIDTRINPACRTQFLTHGNKTTHVIVLVHGITNCPQQYQALAPLFYELGYNVLIPRMPHHGFSDRMTDELKYLTAEELRTFGNTMVDLACGLGEQVTFAGISVGGVVAAWVAQHRTEVAKVVMIAPAFTLGRVGAFLNSIIIDLLLALPNIPTQYVAPFKDGPVNSYLGYSSHAMGQMLRLGLAVRRAALKQQAAVQSITFISNGADTAVSNAVTWQLVNAWQARGLQRLSSYEFPKQLGFIHDIIDPQQVQQHTAVVYPVLLELSTAK